MTQRRPTAQGRKTHDPRTENRSRFRHARPRLRGGELRRASRIFCVSSAYRSPPACGTSLAGMASMDNLSILSVSPPAGWWAGPDGIEKRFHRVPCAVRRAPSSSRIPLTCAPLAIIISLGSGKLTGGAPGLQIRCTGLKPGRWVRFPCTSAKENSRG